MLLKFLLLLISFGIGVISVYMNFVFLFMYFWPLSYYMIIYDYNFVKAVYRLFTVRHLFQTFIFSSVFILLIAAGGSLLAFIPSHLSEIFQILLGVIIFHVLIMISIKLSMKQSFKKVIWIRSICIQIYKKYNLSKKINEC